MTTAKLIHNYRLKLSELDMFVDMNSEEIKEARSNDQQDLVMSLKEDRAVLTMKRQMIVQFIADLEDL